MNSESKESEEIPIFSNNELVPFKENLIRDISLLNKNFDLSSMPSNYMRKRSKIEEIIYKAVFNQNNHKSPFASFKIANDCISDLNKIDIVTGTNNLKKVMQSLYENSEQISIMVHKIGNTWLMDEFDLDALFLGHEHYSDWEWLRKFIEQDRLQLAKPDLSRASLTMRDLYAKFLYHSVNQKSIQLPNNNDKCSEIENVSQLPIFKPTSKHNLRTNLSSSSNRYDHHREDFINLVDWKLNDLSFVVGSDLSIFGTKSHPCISLRLHPCQEPINILTGIDMWLENLLNEVPEVAMCYHDQGIVMREYEIFRTEDIPQISGFNKDEVESIAKNLSHFLSTNATKEGHTYWLFKETDSTMVKLYDLTDIWMKNQQSAKQNDNNVRCVPDGNPFILPVAVLCYKMAENRINQWHRARNKRGKSNLTSSQFNKELLEKKLADDIYYFNDIFRLLKNSINLLIRTDKHQDLVNKAIILMCQLYLEVDQITLNNLHYKQESQSTDIVRFDLSDLKSIDKVSNAPGLITSTSTPSAYEDSNLIGTQLYKLCVKKRREELFIKTLNILESCEVDRNKFNFTNEELILRNHLLSDSDQKLELKEISTAINKSTVVKKDLIESVINYHEIQSLKIDTTKGSVDDIKLGLKSGFMVALFDDNIWSENVTFNREFRFYFNLIKCFIMWHVDLQNIENCPSDTLMDKMDSRIINYFCAVHSVDIIKVVSLFRAIFLSETKRVALSVEDRLHQSWYEIILYLLRLSKELMSASSIKMDRITIQRGISVLINFLVAAIVNLYKQEATKNYDGCDITSVLHKWCRSTVFDIITYITECIGIPDFTSNIEETLLALVWMNKAKLYRLTLAIFNDSDYIYSAIDSYSKAMEILLHSNKKKLLPMSIGIKCDRLDLCMQLLERAYSSVTTNPERSILEMNEAVNVSDKIYRVELAYQSYMQIKARLCSLRLRMNYVRYYLNVKTNKPLNFEQIIIDFQRDMCIIMTETESISKCKESLLIMFYLFKIEYDRLEILSAQSLDAFLRDNVKILNDIISVDSYKDYLIKEGKAKVVEIYEILMNILKKFLLKCQNDYHKKKKNQYNRKVIQVLENYFSNKKKQSSILEELRYLLQDIKDFF